METNIWSYWHACVCVYDMKSESRRIADEEDQKRCVKRYLQFAPRCLHCYQVLTSCVALQT